MLLDCMFSPLAFGAPALTFSSCSERQSGRKKKKQCVVQSHRIKINWDSVHCSLAAGCLLVCGAHVFRANSSMLKRANCACMGARARPCVRVCLRCVGQRGIACWGYRGCSVGVMNRMLLCSVSQLSACLAEEERKVREREGVRAIGR